jgi:hypothetical protein
MLFYSSLCTSLFHFPLCLLHCLFSVLLLCSVIFSLSDHVSLLSFVVITPQSFYILLYFSFCLLFSYVPNDSYVLCFRQQTYSIHFQFLPHEAYKSRFCVTPSYVLHYAETQFFRNIFYALRKKMKFKSSM